MDLDILTESLAKAFDAFKNNIVAYVVAALITVIVSLLSVLIIPLIFVAPLGYGLTYMAVKGARGESVEINDLFFACRSLSRFIRSWLYFVVLLLLIIVIGIIFGILAAVLAMIHEMLVVIAVLVAAVLAFVCIVGMIYSDTIYVMTPPSGVIEVLKRSLTLSKENIGLTIVAAIVMVILNMIGSSLVVLNLITMPFSLLFLVYMVKELDPSIRDTSDNV